MSEIVGRIRFPSGHEATLNEDGEWECDVYVFRSALNRDYSPNKSSPADGHPIISSINRAAKQFDAEIVQQFVDSTEYPDDAIY